LNYSQEEYLLYQANLLQHVSDAIIATDLSFKITSWNQAAETIYGWRAGEVLGQTIQQVLQTEYAYARSEQVLQQFMDQGLWKGEVIQKHKDGSNIYALASVSLIKDKAGQPIGAVAVNRDITKQKQAGEALQQSEARFTKVFQSSPEAIAITRQADGQILEVNASWEALFGYRREEAISQSASKLHLYVEPLERQRLLDQLQSQGNVSNMEVRLRRKSGEVRQILVSMESITLDHEPCLLIFNRDITERKWAEEQFRLVVEASPQGVILVNAEGLIKLVNARTEALFGYTREELLGQSVEILVPSQFRAHHDSYRNTFFAAPTVRPMGAGRDLFGTRKDGRLIPVEIGLTPLNTSTGPFVMASIIDITERKQAEERLKETLTELGRSNTELEQFAYVASHDLQEPLRMVSSYTQLLARRYKGKLDADADEFIAFAVDGALRMKRLLNDLLAYSRVSTRGHPLRSISSEAVLDQTLANLQVAITESQATITHDPLPIVLADQTQLLQLFQNLIANALKFRAEQPPEVHISAEARGREWLFSIRDNGIGIDPQFADRIFVIFQRLHNQADYPGTGIGLAICKRIVERHAGRIWVESQPGQGATFYFTLPAVEAKVVPE
jgi:PAS domain S-box-containing protein